MPAALPQPDFLRPVARPGALAWAWCATGLAVLAASVPDGQAAWQQRAQALARQAERARPPVATSAPAPRPEQLAREGEARRWLQQLAQPWPAVWAASEAAAQGVTWLALAHGDGADGGGNGGGNGGGTGAGTLRLTGLAADLAPAQTAAQALRDQRHQGRPLWQDVVLASVERVPEGRRFTLVARLADLAPRAPDTHTAPVVGIATAAPVARIAGSAPGAQAIGTSLGAQAVGTALGAP